MTTATAMSMKKKLILMGGLGLLCLLGSGVAVVVAQICFGTSFWLHAMVAPLNPQTVFPPTAMSYVGAVCQALFPVLLIVGVGLLIGAAKSLLILRPRC